MRQKVELPPDLTARMERRAARRKAQIEQVEREQADAIERLRAANRGKPGRPRIILDREKAREVAAEVDAGWSMKRIADVYGVVYGFGRHTLKKWVDSGDLLVMAYGGPPTDDDRRAAVKPIPEPQPGGRRRRPLPPADIARAMLDDLERGASQRQIVAAYGHRNAFRFSAPTLAKWIRSGDLGRRAAELAD